MTDVVIKAEHLGKKYTIGHQAENGSYTALRDVLMHNARMFWRKTKDLAKGKAIIQGDTQEEVWALKGVSFEIKRGEAVGVIGRNGAGKSTLLKVLSRITEPSAGRVTIKGRVASLLEVGTGFHPELTGRENIYLNGAILGMSRAEIKRKFDEIVAFAEVEKFLDTPVKRYSSGMYVRLAFAVAAHLEPEILVIDEVLAVGDAPFQKKCLGKMSDVTREGRTVLFVSHNMSAVAELCTRAFLLETGAKGIDGVPRDVIAAYLATGGSEAEVDLDTLNHKGPRRYVRLRHLRLLNRQGHATTTYTMNEPFVAQIEIQCIQAMRNAEVGLKISSCYGSAIHYLTSTWEGLSVDLGVGTHVFEVRVPALTLYPGIYVVGLWVLSEPEWSDDSVQEITRFTVLKGDVTGFRTRMEQYVASGCEVYVPNEWEIISQNA